MKYSSMRKVVNTLWFHGLTYLFFEKFTLQLRERHKFSFTKKRWRSNLSETFKTSTKFIKIKKVWLNIL